MPLVATILSEDVLLWAGLHPTQLLFYTTWKRMTAEYPCATNGNLGREQGMPEFTKAMQDKSFMDESIEVTKGRLAG